MSGYHCHVTFISRGAGQSVVAKGAYHARAEFREEWRRGEKKDYTDKADRPVWSVAMADKAAPASFHQVESLLNEMDGAKTQGFPDRLEHHPCVARQAFARAASVHAQGFMREQFLPEAACRRRPYSFTERTWRRPQPPCPCHRQHPNRRAGGFRGEEIYHAGKLRPAPKQWREKWADLGARYLEKAGNQQEADQWREGHRTLEQQSQAALERGDLALAETLKSKKATKHRGPKVDAVERRGVETTGGTFTATR